jgi:hypothetical protein
MFGSRISRTARKQRATCGLIVVCLATASCGTLPNGRGWGQDATIAPGWQRLGDTARHNAKKKTTWIPLITAGVLYVGDLDERISDWVVDNTPVFGSTENADEASDHWRDALRLAAFGTAIAAPSGGGSDVWLTAKTKGLLIQAAAFEVTSLTTDVIKDASSRTRPNGKSDRSFPSGHTSAAAAGARLSERNLRTFDFSAATTRVTDALLVTGTAMTGWARVEAGVHYPSDVLAGAALGSFLAGFVHDGFMGLPVDYLSARYDRRQSMISFAIGARF